MPRDNVRSITVPTIRQLENILRFTECHFSECPPHHLWTMTRVCDLPDMGALWKGKQACIETTTAKELRRRWRRAMSQFVASLISHAALGVTGTAGRVLHFSLAGRIGESGFLGYCQVSRTWRIPVSAYFSVGISGEIRRPRDIERLYLIYSMTFLRLCSISADIEVLFLHCIHTLYFIVIIYCYYLFRKKNCKSNTRVFNFLDFRSISPSLVRQGNVNFNLLI